LLVALTNVRVDGDLELSVESERKDVQRSGASIGASIAAKPGLQLAATAEMPAEGRTLLLETRRGSERIALNFSDVAPALRELAGTLSSRRVWLMLAEWSSVPRDLQPYLAEFLVRCGPADRIVEDRVIVDSEA
jgi:hypothetical protein